MRRVAWTSLVLILIMGFSILGGVVGSAYSWNEGTHKNQFTKAALELVRENLGDQEYGPEIWEEFSRFIMQGAHDEDFPCELFAERDAPALFEWMTGLDRMSSLKFDLRANNHYGHGIVPGVGLTCSFLPKGDLDTDPLNWAKTNLPFESEEEFKGGEFWYPFGWSAKDLDGGNMSWKNAIDRYGYTDDSKELAYYTLGFILHLLQDMGEPEHVHDDPHGGSSITGFERYTEDHWEELKPAIRSLRPWRFEAGQTEKEEDKSEFSGNTDDYFIHLKDKKETDEEKSRRFSDLNPYFTRLGKIAYSATRFKGFVGQDPPKDPSNIEKGSDLERMFDIDKMYHVSSLNPPEAEWGWRLRNKNAPMSRNLMYLPESYGKDPTLHKGRDTGDWWSTSGELKNIGKEKVDAEGYYYIELSPDLPIQDPGRAAYNRDLKKGFGKNDLYPMAYLPSPLEEVNRECQGWLKESLDGETHLYTILVKNLSPQIVQASAGLIQHYFDIVNHPPYVKTVLVFQADKRYDAYWEDQKELRPGTDRISDVKGRTLAIDTNKPLQPGKTFISVFFSEPVQKPEITVGTIDVKNLKDDPENTSWSGSFEIPEEGPASDMLRISIRTTDRDRHYRNEGGLLDAFPDTPARRRVWENGYRWMGYYPGNDENHRLQVVRYPTEVKIRSINPIVPNLAEISYRYEKGTHLGKAVRPLRIKAGQKVSLDVEWIVFGPPWKPVDVTINPIVTGWAKFSGETPPPLRLEPIQRTVRLGREESQRVERTVLSFPIPYPTAGTEPGSLHDLRFEFTVNGKVQQPLVIADAFEVIGPGTDFNGTGDLGICVALPEEYVDNEAYMGVFYRGKVKVSLYPITGLVAPAPKILSNTCFSEFVDRGTEVDPDDYAKIPLGRYKVVAEVQGDEDYKGPRTGSTIVTLHKWNPQDRHAGVWHARIKLGKADAEKRPDFVEQSKPKDPGASVPKEWFVHVKVMDLDRKGISGARVFTQEGHMEAKDQDRGEYLLGPIKNVENLTRKYLTVVAEIPFPPSFNRTAPQPQTELAELKDQAHVYVTFQFSVSVPPAFVKDSKTKRSTSSGTVVTPPAPPEPPVTGRTTGSQTGTSTTPGKRKDCGECIRTHCPMCKDLLLCTTVDSNCQACINSKQPAIRQCMEEVR